MKIIKLKRMLIPLNWLRLGILLLIIGIFFRFVNLDKKLYWKDETHTSLRISGYTTTEIVQQISDAGVINIKDLQKYQRLNAEKGLIDTIKGLAVEEPQHPPLYFVMLRFWVQWLGSSVAAIRSLSALISLLVFPCLYWLCLELFELPLTGWVAITLMAISPFNVLYAQEAREYSLWTVTTLLSSAALLRAMRLQTKLSWGTYAVTIALGLYSFLLSGLVSIAHGVYLVTTERLRFSRTVIAYLLASLAGLIAFSPWILTIFTYLHQAESTTDWLTKKISLFSLVTRWAGNLSRIFLDLGLDSSNSLVEVAPLTPLILLLLILSGYSIYFLCFRTSKRVWLFILILILVTSLPFMLLDLTLGGQRSGTARYLIPCYLGIQIAVAYLLATKTTGTSVNFQDKKLWQVITILLISSGIFSCAISYQSDYWWNKGAAEDPYIPQMAHIINRANHPLLIGNGSLGKVRSLSYILDKKVYFQLVEPPNLPKIPEGFSEIFLYNFSNISRAEIEKKQNYVLEPIPELGRFQDILWRLDK